MEAQSFVGDLARYKHPQTFQIMFVCQGGEIEMQSVLFAASLKMTLKTPAKIVAGIPQREDGSYQPSSISLDFLRSLNVKIVPFHNPVAEERDFEQPYPHSNKIYLFNLETSAEKVIFFDSDTIFLKDPFDKPAFRIPFTLLPVGFPGGYNEGASWDAIYDTCGLEMPSERMIHRDTREPHGLITCGRPNAFTANFIGVAGEHRQSFCSAWDTAYRKLINSGVLLADDGGLIKMADQIALSLAVISLKIPYIHQWEGGSMRYHYVNFQTLAEQPAAISLVKNIAAAFPEIASIYEELRAKELIKKWSDELELSLRS